MEVFSNIVLNLQAPAFATVFSPQGQTLSRSIQATLMDGATPWEIPETALCIIRYAKPDGTKGFYDTLEDDSSAYSYNGNVVTFGLATQALTVPGTVLMQLDFYNSDGEKLSTFTFRLIVAEGVFADSDIASEDFINVLTAKLTEAAKVFADGEAEAQQFFDENTAEAQQIFNQIKQIYGAPWTAATAAAMTDTSRVYVYTGTTTDTLTNGHWYYWDGTAWADGGVYNSTAFETDPTLTIAGAAADAKATGDAVEDLNRQLSDVESALGNVYYIRHDANIVNPNTQSVGALNTNGTVNTSYTNYLVSDFIPVDPNSDYTYTLWINASTKTNTRKYIALYNANKEYIDGSYQNVTGQFYVTFNTSSAAYVRVASANDTTDFLSKGSGVPSSFVEYSEHYINKLEFDSETIPQSAIDFDDYFIKANNINLYNQNTDVNGYIGPSGAVLTDSDSYKTTDYIAVRSTFKYFSVGYVRFVGYYDSNKMFISRDVDASYNPKITPTNSGFIRVTYYVDNPLTSIEEVFDGTATKKIEEGIALSHYQLAQAQEELTLGKGYGNILYGKKWAVCGDSFTNNGGTGTIIQDGKYAGKAYTYPWLIGNRNNMDIVQFFGGGRTLAFPAEPGSFVNSLTCPTQTFYYQNIPTDVDYITIYLGINDRNHSTGSSGDGEDTTGDIPLGTVDDTTTETYLGAYNVVLKWLITNRPNAHIGMIVTNGIAAADSYRQGQIAIAQKYGIPYIDMNGDSRTPAMLRTSNPNIPAEVKQALIAKWAVNSPTNEHPNDAAQMFESTFIENFLRSI